MEDEVLRPTRHPDDHVNARGDETGAFAALAAAAALLPVPTPTTTPLASPLPDVRVTSSSPTPSANSGPGAGAGAGASARRSMTPASSGERAGASALSRRASQIKKENRAANRLSGFFSHLFSGDGVPSTSSTSASNEPTRRTRESEREERRAEREKAKSNGDASTSALNGTSGNGGDKGKERASTPPPPPPPPPPALPPPTLAELGLTLSAMTTALSSGGGGSSAPASGTFVLPHFLLLCAPHGLDVLPLAGPGTGGLLALVRRVPFKSVVVMEERGVVVAIAGRRDTVRVYALEEVRRMIEWRVDGVARKSARSATSAKRSTFALGGSNSPVPPLPSSSSAVVAVKTKKLQTPLTAASTTSTATSIGTPSAAAAAAGPPPSYAAALVAPMDGRSAVATMAKTVRAARSTEGMRAAGAAAVNGLGHGQSASTSSVASVPVPSHVHAHAHAHPQRSATMGPAPLAALAAAAKVDTPVPKSPTDDGPIVSSSSSPTERKMGASKSLGAVSGVGLGLTRPVVPTMSSTTSKQSLAAISASLGKSRARATSVSTIKVADDGPGEDAPPLPQDTFEQKRAGDWMDDPGSDDEALVAVGPGGSAALDERTSAAAAAGRSGSGGVVPHRSTGMSIDSVATSEAGGRPSLHVLSGSGSGIGSGSTSGPQAVSTSTGSIATLRQTAQPGSPTTVRAPNAADAVAPPTSPTLSPGKRKTRPADLDLSTVSSGASVTDAVPTVTSLDSPVHTLLAPAIALVETPASPNAPLSPLVPLVAPAPTLLTLRQSLQQTLSQQRARPSAGRRSSIFGIQVAEDGAFASDAPSDVEELDDSNGDTDLDPLPSARRMNGSSGTSGHLRAATVDSDVDVPAPAQAQAQVQVQAQAQTQIKEREPSLDAAASVDTKMRRSESTKPKRRPQMSLVEALQESRIPEAPPLGSRSGPTAPPVPTGSGLNPTATMINPFNSSAALSGLAPHPAVAPLSLGRRWSEDRIATARSASASGVALSSSPTAMASTPPPGRSPSPLPGSPSRASNMQREPGQGHQHTPSAPPSLSSTPRHRFLPRIITAAFGRSSSAGVSEEVGGHGHGGEDGAAEREMVQIAGHLVNGKEGERVAQVSVASMGPPKMEFVKLPGTKGAMMVKAVETARKSFLAILCGEQGEKVELFAGTYKTALGLSRTFILPDSPRNLELQLQGDDLVEIFLVFGGNVFGLEPATVRVREVRIGRQERRARRRARQARAEGASAGAEDDVDVQVNVAVENSDDLGSLAPPTPSQELEPPNSILAPASAQTVVTSTVTAGTAATAVDERERERDREREKLQKEEEDQMGPYTTFQQLNFAPTFPLGTIADECIIPPSYPNFVRYREDWEGTPQDAGAIAGPSSVSDAIAPPASVSALATSVAVDAGGLSPPGLPTPPSQPPTRWFYKDPKGVVQGPFKTAMMQGWFKDGFLPLDLPVRREVETEYTLLRDLRAQSVDPTQPFKPQPLPLTPPAEATAEPALITIPTEPKPLLPPVSLLKQPKHFGPPALFFSSRGGHSTSVVDARGKSVLKGRLMWSAPNAQAGEVRRVEAFDVQDRAVVVALRRSALEAIDVGDALLNPGDDSRAFVPEYSAAPVTTNRRSPFVWRIGAPLNPPPTGALRSESTPNLAAGLSSSGMAGKLLKKEKPDWMLALENDLSGDPLPSKHASQEEVLFLGREGDNVFFAEKSASHFRVLRLAPTYPQSSS